MNYQSTCKNCGLHYDIFWDDTSSAVEDDVLGDHVLDRPEDEETDLFPEHCPFCGTHIFFDPDDH